MGIGRQDCDIPRITIIIIIHLVLVIVLIIRLLALSRRMLGERTSMATRLLLQRQDHLPNKKKSVSKAISKKKSL
jgi:hypothetical protein